MRVRADGDAGRNAIYAAQPFPEGMVLLVYAQLSAPEIQLVQVLQVAQRRRQRPGQIVVVERELPQFHELRERHRHLPLQPIVAKPQDMERKVADPRRDLSGEQVPPEIEVLHAGQLGEPRGELALDKVLFNVEPSQVGQVRQLGKLSGKEVPLQTEFQEPGQVAKLGRHFAN